jgi:hypothetical protein
MQMYCLMQGDKPMTETVRDALLVNAYDMYQDKKRTRRIRSKTYDGVLETNLKPVFFVGMTGLVFDALVKTESAGGETTVRFFVRTSDLEDGFLERGKWVDHEELGAMVRRSLRRHAEMN